MFSFIPNKEREWQTLNGYTFIMPAVAIGNIGQLAVDLIISSVSPEKIARLSHPVFLPVVGSDPYTDQERDIMTASELYICESKKLVILQIRSLLIKEHCVDFLCQLVDWMKKCEFSKTVLLSSCHSYERIDCQLVGTPFRYTATDAVDAATKEEIMKQRWTSLEARHAPCDPDGEKVIFFPGGGYTNQLHTLCEKLSIPLITLLIFCAPGDNIPGVLLVAGHLNTWLNILPSAHENETPSWKFPLSWKQFFGNAPPGIIY